MKYNVRDLFEQTKALEDRYYAIEAHHREEWHEQQLPRWQALRDMITQAIRSKRVITREDVVEAIGSGETDLDAWSRPMIFYPKTEVAAVRRGRHVPIANLRHTRPRVTIQIYFGHLLSFRDLLEGLVESEVETVTDAELAEMGFSRYPAVVTRLTNTLDANLCVTQEIY